MFYFFLLILLLLIFFIIILKKNFLLDNVHFSKHKNFTTSDIRIPVSAGFFITIFIIFFNQRFMTQLSLFLLCIIFFSGFLSDIYKNFSPLLRLLIQFLSSYLFIISNEIFIIDTRVHFLNDLLINYKYLSILFTIFCIIVLINGTNFIDGVNINAIGYYIIVYSVIFYVCKSENIIINFNFLIQLILFLLFLLMLNIFNKRKLDRLSCNIHSWLDFHICTKKYFIAAVICAYVLWAGNRSEHKRFTKTKK